jgi:zinc protease
VGSKDEKPGRTGFAHLFEHMMFKGSKNVDPEEHASMLASIGGQTNAYTNDDATVFWQTVPSQYLPLVLWLEADRMATLRIDKTTFENEREVVKEERRLRVDNQPFGRLQEILYDAAFLVSPYKHTTIGSMADLDAASVADVRDFHNTYYVPGNATVAIVGDFDMAQAKDLVRRYLGRVPNADAVIPREYPREKPQTGERRITVNESWPLPAVIVAYPITYDGHPDSYPLHLTSKILSDGDSSRIYQSLVYEKQIAVSAFGGGMIIEEPNLFYAVALVAPGRSHDEVEKALIAEFDKLRAEPISERELQRAKNQFFRDYIVDRESIRGKASQLAHAVVIHGDVTTADGEVEIFTEMKVSDLHRVANTYFTPQNRLVLKILPKGSR